MPDPLLHKAAQASQQQLRKHTILHSLTTQHFLQPVRPAHWARTENTAALPHTLISHMQKEEEKQERKLILCITAASCRRF
jgi:hypothetical protein